MINTIWLIVIAACLISFAASILVGAMLAISRDTKIKKTRTDHAKRRAILRKLNPNLIR